MSERIIEIRFLCIEPEYVIDYSDYERRIRMIEERGREIELRYNHNHDEKGRFCSGVGGGRAPAGNDVVYGREESSKNNKKTVDNIDNSVESDIIESGGDYLDSKPRLKNHSVNDCYNTVNPNYEKDLRFQKNCQRCIIAYEARRRGFDVQAKPGAVNDEPAKHASHPKGWASVFEGGRDGIIKINDNSPDEAKGIIKAFMEKCGNGSRAAVEVHSPLYKGHVFIAEQIKGKTHFIDPQTGERNVEYIFDLGLTKGSTQILRIDNRQFTPLIEDFVE